jgi:hypothetical protein
VTFGSADTIAVRVGRMTFFGLVRGTDRVTAERAEFESLKAEASGRKIEIPAAKIAGFAMPPDAFRALTEGGGSVDWNRLAETAAAAEIIIDVITDEAGPDATTAYTEFALTQLQAGRIETVRMSGSRGHNGAADSPDHVRFSTDEIRYQGIDLAEIARFFTGGGSGGAKRLIEQAVVRGWSLTAVDIAIRIAKMELAALDGRAPTASLAQTAAPAGGPPRIVLPGQRDEDAATRRAAAYAREVLQHLRVSRLALEGVNIASPDLGIIEVGTVALNDLSSAGFALLELKGLDFSAPGAAAKFDRFALEKFAFGGVLDWLLDTLASGREPELDADKLSQLAPRVGSARIERLEAESPVGLFSLAEARFEVDNPDAVLPERLAFVLNGIKLDVARATDSNGREQLMALGYPELAASFQLLVRWTPNERALAFEDTRLIVEQVGRIDLSARFANVDLDPAKPQAAEEAMGRAHIEHVAARMTDLGLADRLFGQMARGMGLSSEAVRAGIAAEIRAQAEAMLGPALTPGSGAAIEAFIRTPKSIAARATFKPGQPPVTMAELEQIPPAQLLQRLTIAIETPKE